MFYYSFFLQGLAATVTLIYAGVSNDCLKKLRINSLGLIFKLI